MTVAKPPRPFLDFLWLNFRPFLDFSFGVSFRWLAKNQSATTQRILVG